jgi:hypothetical protein
LAQARPTACTCACNGRASASTICGRASRRRRRRQPTSPSARGRAAAARAPPEPRATPHWRRCGASSRPWRTAYATRRRVRGTGPARGGLARLAALGGRNGTLPVPCGRSASPSPSAPTSVQIERGIAGALGALLAPYGRAPDRRRVEPHRLGSPPEPHRGGSGGTRLDRGPRPDGERQKNARDATADLRRVRGARLGGIRSSSPSVGA